MNGDPIHAPVYYVGSPNRVPHIFNHLASLNCPVKQFYSAETLTYHGNGVALLIVAEQACDDSAETPWAAMIRARHDILAYAPILAIGKPATGDLAYESLIVDQWLDPDVTRSDLKATLAIWNTDENSAMDRLMGIFGHEEIASLTLRFRTMLIDAIDAMRTPSASHVAHRVAGMAGTLGFAELSARWERFDPANQEQTPVLRATRHAIFEISRRLGNRQ